MKDIFPQNIYFKWWVVLACSRSIFTKDNIQIPTWLRYNWPVLWSAPRNKDKQSKLKVSVDLCEHLQSEQGLQPQRQRADNCRREVPRHITMCRRTQNPSLASSPSPSCSLPLDAQTPASHRLKSPYSAPRKYGLFANVIVVQMLKYAWLLLNMYQYRPILLLWLSVHNLNDHST